LNSLTATLPRVLATMLLWVGCVSGSMACVFPQDDQVIPDRPPVANRPVRIVSGSAKPAQRETVIRLGLNCPREAGEFSVRVSDPDGDDAINATWFIDPNERYVATQNSPVFPGNPGARLSGDLRTVTSPSVLRATLQQFVGGQKRRVEVVVTDGTFIESELTDPVTGEGRPFLDATRGTVRGENGEVFAVEAFRDEYVWLVEVSTAPCP
jgi:hypothetical protein